MFNTKSAFGLQRRIDEQRGRAAPAEPLFDRAKLAQDVRPLAQKRIQTAFTAEELGERENKALRTRVRSVILELIEQKAPEMPRPAQLSLAEELLNDLLGYGPLERYFTGEMKDRVTEIKVVRHDLIRVEIDGKETVALDEKGRPLAFRSEEHVRDVLDRMLAPSGRRIDLASPRVSARLPDGSRLMAHIPPVAVNGTTFSVRRFRMDMTAGKFLDCGTLNQEMLDFLRECVQSRFNIVVSGGTSSGKSTFLNVLASFIPEDESIVTIEDPAELQLQHTNVRQLEARPPNIEGKGEVTQRDLVADALRMAPKRIIVGECRKGEAFDMMQAMNTGHDGSLTTAHANTAREMINVRLTNMIQMADMGLPFEAILNMVAGAVDLVVHIQKDRDGQKKINHVSEVGEVKSVEGAPRIILHDIFRYDP
ncbi:MAG: CpaF family protein, partial [Candidatus Desulforudis sp.]|nr:CpaF family protein [Desulforudis sp.]